MEYLAVCLVSVFVTRLTFSRGSALAPFLMPFFAVYFPVEVAINAGAMVRLAKNYFKNLLVRGHTD